MTVREETRSRVQWSHQMCVLCLGNSSLSYHRLAIKLCASLKCDLGLEMMKKAWEADKYHTMNYWSLAVLTLIVGVFTAVYRRTV